MPPKTKGKKEEAKKGAKKEAKAKPPAEVDVFSTEEMSKDQLEEHVVRLREELDREREERSYFQLERDKVQALCEIRNRNLEERKAELRNKQRERREAQEHHRVEITEYKQKLKHVLSEQHNTTSELKIDGVASTSLLQHQHSQSELLLREELHNLQTDFRKKTLENADGIKELKMRHQVELMELTQVYNQRIEEQALKDQMQFCSELEVESKKHQVEILSLEERYRSRVEILLEEQKAERRLAQREHTHAHNLKREELSKKEKNSKLKTDLAREERKVSAAKRENKRLQQSLQEAQQKLSELHKEREENNKAKAEIKRSRARQKVIEKELRDLGVEHMLLEQACEKVEKERDELLKTQREAILDIQQRSGLKEMMLQNKLAVQTEALEKEETLLSVLLAHSNVDQAAAGGATSKLLEIMESKNATVSALEADLARDCQEYEELLKMSKDRLKALGVPLYNFPFRSSKQILGGLARVQNFSPAVVKK